MIRYLMIFISFFVTACSDFSGFGTDNTPPPKPLVQFTPSRHINSLWAAKVGKGTDDESHPKLRTAIANDKAITADSQGNVSAHAIRNGTLLWKTPTHTTITSGPTANQSLVIVGTNHGQVIALKAHSGVIAWKANVANQVLAAPTLSNDKVLVKTIDGRLMALSTTDGHPLWSHEHGSPLLVLRGGSAPQVVDNLVVAGFADGKLAAFDLNQGKLLWERAIAMPTGLSEIERMVDIGADPVVSEGIVYVVSYQGNLASILPRNGEMLWEHAISSEKDLAFDHELLYVSDMQSHLWAFYRNSGRVAWQQTQLEARDITAPAVIGDMIVVADAQGYLHWLSREDGHFVARVFIDKSGIALRPAVINDQVLVMTRSGKLVAFKVS